MSHKPPSNRQLSYLKALAKRTGRSFVWPTSCAHASREIRRLKAIHATGFSFAELQAEQAARHANDDVSLYGPSVRPDEVSGWGAGATWSQRP